MRDYAEIFGPAMRRFGSSRPLERFSNVCFAGNTSEIIQEQRVRAEQFRLAQQTDTIQINEVIDELKSLPEQKPEVSLFSVDDLIRGPKVVAFKLAKKATLNRDQMCLVALAASLMQAEWEKQQADEPQLKDSSASCWDSHSGDAPLMKLTGGVIARILFVGGGGMR